MRTTGQIAALALVLALQDRTNEAAHVLMHLGPQEQEDVRRALTALLLVCAEMAGPDGAGEEDGDG